MPHSLDGAVAVQLSASTRRVHEVLTWCLKHSTCVYACVRVHTCTHTWTHTCTGSSMSLEASEGWVCVFSFWNLPCGLAQGAKDLSSPALRRPLTVKDWMVLGSQMDSTHCINRRVVEHPLHGGQCAKCFTVVNKIVPSITL